MFFCSGPPRTYTLPRESSAKERLEDVAVAVHPFLPVFATVSASQIIIWSTSARQHQLSAGHATPTPAHYQRQLAVISRGGAYIPTRTQISGTTADKVNDENETLVSDGGCADLHAIWALWVADLKLAVVEKGSQSVEFYAFDGLLETISNSPRDGNGSTTIGGGSVVKDPADLLAGSVVKGRLVEDFPLNQGELPSEKQDVAASMTGIAGGKYLFVGMASGMICVVEVVSSSASTAWFGPSSTSTKIWKIDVLPHLKSSDPSAEAASTPVEDIVGTPPSCYSVTCASAEPPMLATSLYLVACFEGGKCFIMLISPAVKCIDQLLSLVNTERDSSPMCFGRCTVSALDSSGSQLALGWSDGGVSLFRLTMKRNVQPATQTKASGKGSESLMLEPLRELSLTAWGYTTEDTGGVTALAWSLDARSITIGYELRGFSLFSTDGCRLMSSLPQHNQQRPERSINDEHSMKEICAYGVLALAWTKESFSLLVIPRGEQSERLEAIPQTALEEVEAVDSESDLIQPEDLYEEVVVELLKDEDGLCLSLSGAPGRCGAWVRSENSFTRRARDGGIGPAEASGSICGGDLLISINDNAEVVNFPFEEIVRMIKKLPHHQPVKLMFLRLQWEKIFPLAAQGLTAEEFMDTHGIQLLGDEELSIREYALRMQALHGDCDLEDRPPLLEFERRAKFHGWEAIQGTSTLMAMHKYVKLLFALFPVWNPRHILTALAEYGNATLAHDRTRVKQQKLKELQRGRQLVPMRKQSGLGFVELDFAKTVAVSGGKNSHSVLLEAAKLRLVAAPSPDDPCSLTSCVNWDVPSDFEAKCCPLRLVAVSTSGNHIAVTGQRGFCLLNLVTGKWRMFGNVNEEQDISVCALVWIKDDVILVSFTRFSEKHATLHVQAYPRNHLDEESILAQLAFPRERSSITTDTSLSSRGASGAFDHEQLIALSLDDEKSECFYAMETDKDETNVFCISRKELWCFGLELTGSIKQNDLAMEMTMKRKVKLPASVAEAAGNLNTQSSFGALAFTALPRFLHIQDEKLKQEQQHKYQAERELEQQENSGSWWLSSIVNMLAGGEVPDQYTPEDVLPRFAFLDSAGDVIVWDPENRSQRVLCSNVSTMTRLFVTPQASPSWPTPCRLIYGLYGPEGMKIWLPLLDGVYLKHTKAFEEDIEQLETFLACHDPLRAKTYEIEFGTAPATADLYEHVVAEYGIVIEKFRDSSAIGGFVNPIAMARSQLEDGVKNLRGCIASVDDPAAKDRMLRFDSDVKVLGVEPTFGLLVGVSQDVYVPSGVALPCYDLFSRMQPFFHTLLCFLVQNDQIAWAKEVLAGVRRHFALSTLTQELFLHSMLEACFSTACSEAKLQAAIELLQPESWSASPTTAILSDQQESVKKARQKSTTIKAEGDVDEYCEIVAHVARKSEPSRLKLLFPAAGDPLDLLVICKQRSELRTAANFLLILEECSTSAPSSFRTTCAAELVAQCIEHEEWVLAQHVVRVAREWEHPDEQQNEEAASIDEQLATYVYEDLMRGEFERVVWCVEELQAKLPRVEKAPEFPQDEAMIAQHLHETFVQSKKRRELKVLLQAVTEARYEKWARLIRKVMNA